MTTCTDEFPDTSTLYSELIDEKSEFVLTIICGVFALAILIIFFEELRFLAKVYQYKQNRLVVTYLLSIYPLVATQCMIALLVPRSTMLTELLSAICLSFGVACYVRLIITYFGGNRGIVSEYEGDPLSFQNPPCCCCCFCLHDVQFTKKNLRKVKLLTTQMVILRPLTMYIAAILWTDNNYDLGESANFERASVYLQIIKGFSTLFAMWGLITLYNGTREKLSDHHVRPKFIALQIAVILSDLQLFILLILGQRDVISCSGSRGPVVRAYRFHYFLLIFEMFLLSLLARFGYRRDDCPYRKPEGELQMANAHVVNGGYQQPT